MNLADWLYRSAAAAPDRPALFEGTEPKARYGDFADRAARFARALQDRGLRPGDRVALWRANDPDYLVALFGIWWMGGVVVPVNAKLHPAEAAWILDHCGAALVFTDAEHHALLRETDTGVPVLADLGPLPAPGLPRPLPRAAGDLAWIFYTSGTTGRPKGAMLTHGNLVALSLAYLADVADVAPGDCLLYAAPMSHGAGLYALVFTLRGARHGFPPSKGFDAAEVLGLARALGRVSLFAAPTMVRRMTEAARSLGLDGEGLATVIYGGGPMYGADLAQALQVLGPRFVQIYGQGESPMTISVLGRDDHGTAAAPGPRIGSVGRAHCVVDLRITRDGQPVAPGIPGEIELRGPTVMAGYFADAEATARSLRDGWLATGDIGSLDAEGYLTLHDRSKDVIISGGSNIYPREVEEVLLRHPAVREVSVIGQPDPEWGEIVVACLAADPVPGLEAALDSLCRDSIARFKRPRRYLVLPDLPKNHYGKILKADLRARLR